MGPLGSTVAWLLQFMASRGLSAHAVLQPRAARLFLQRAGDHHPFRWAGGSCPVPSQRPSSAPRTAPEHPAGGEQNEGAGGMDGDGCGFQLPREESLWLVFSGNLELGLFRFKKKKSNKMLLLLSAKGKRKSLSVPWESKTELCWKAAEPARNTQVFEGWEAQMTQWFEVSADVTAGRPQ